MASFIYVCIVFSFYFSLFSIFPIQCNILTAYDCGRKDLNYTRINIRDVGVCDLPKTETKTSEALIQLLQLTDSFPQKGILCKVRITRFISHCGMHSHASMVPSGLASYYHRLGPQECRALHATHSFSLGPNIRLYDIKPNSSTTRTLLLAGKFTGDSSCSGGYYSDSFGDWHDVVVQGTVDITLGEVRGNAFPDSDSITFSTGVNCKFSVGYCDDVTDGELVWVPGMEGDCGMQKYTVLYEGSAYLTTVANTDLAHIGSLSYNMLPILTVNNTEMLFSLKLTKTYMTCFHKAFQTEHPRLIIVMGSNLAFTLKRKPIDSKSLDLFLYVNTKFVYLERNIEQNMRDLYNRLNLQRCLLERDLLKTQLSIARLDPNEFAWLRMGGAGYTAVLQGEVIYIVQCTAVPVKINTGMRCFSELPVTYNNATWYVASKTRILQQFGTEIACSNIIPTQFEISGDWWSFTPRASLATPPGMLEPNLHDKWVYKSIDHLATAGIYSTQDLDDFQHVLMYPNERSAVSNVIVRGARGYNPDEQGASILNMLNEDGIKNIGEKVVQKLWGWFSVFGNVASGIIGILFIGKGIKFVIDTIINGTALYEVYGCGLVLFGSVWDALTGYLLNRQSLKKTSVKLDGSDGKNAKEEEIELVISAPPVEPNNDPASTQLYPQLYPYQSGFNPQN